jgi:hypothetical protein
LLKLFFSRSFARGSAYGTPPGIAIVPFAIRLYLLAVVKTPTSIPAPAEPASPHPDRAPRPPCPAPPI